MGPYCRVSVRGFGFGFGSGYDLGWICYDAYDYGGWSCSWVGGRMRVRTLERERGRGLDLELSVREKGAMKYVCLRVGSREFRLSEV